ncbi:hypothetical protein ACFLX4_01120 [Chloroflexota bacterium]
MRMIDISKVPTPQLLEIRRILTGGVLAESETKKTKELKMLQAENTRLKRINDRRAVLDRLDVDIDSDLEYWLNLDDKTFKFVVGKMKDIKVECAIAEKSCSMRIPPIISQRELSTIDTIRQTFNEIKDRRNGNMELN